LQLRGGSLLVVFLDFWNFGAVRETRFGVPKITSFVTPPVMNRLENELDLPSGRSKNGRIRAVDIMDLMFQNSLRSKIPLIVRGQ